MRVALAFLLLLIGEASAHSWYPSACCGGQDCEPVAKIVPQADGTEGVITATGAFVVIPKWMTPTPSEDGGTHVCYIKDVWSHFTPRCYFKPGVT